MTTAQSWLLTGCIVALSGAAIYGGCGLTRVGYTALENLNTAALGITETTVAATETITAMNAPCVGFHGSVTCGPIAQLSQTEKNVGIVAGKSAEQVMQTGTLIKAAVGNINKAGDSVTELTGHLSKTADAATTGVTALSADLTAMRPTIDAGTLLIRHGAGTLDDLDSMILEDGPVVHKNLVNLQSMTGSGALMLSDAQWKEHQLLHPDKVKLTLWTGTEAGLLWTHNYVLPKVSLF